MRRLELDHWVGVGVCIKHIAVLKTQQSWNLYKNPNLFCNCHPWEFLHDIDHFLPKGLKPHNFGTSEARCFCSMFNLI